MTIRRMFLLIWVLTAAACSDARPTPLFLLTSTPTPALSTATDHPIASSPASSPTHPPASSTTQPEPTQPPASPTVLPTASSTPAPPTPTRVFPPLVALEPLWSGFQGPVYLTYADITPAWAARLFVVEKAGRILWLENGHIQATPFLDITDRVGSRGSEQGLLSVAFAPDFDRTRFFYVNYTDLHGDTIVARYRLLQHDPPLGDPTSEQVILQIDQPAGNHNGGQLQFGPDGYLYIGNGDGGQAGDPWGNAQNPGELLGKMLRIDVRDTDSYRIPTDNPFVAWADVRSEIWALGLRNPWRFSFDRATGDLYIADVGQNQYEEVNFQPAFSRGGENYGWDILEAAHCFEPPTGCDISGLIPPVMEYDHGQGCSISGGYVYRGALYPQLDGIYLLGDYCSGRMWGLQRTPSGEWRSALLLDTDLSISSFGQDAAGELYVLDYSRGTIYRVTALP